LDRASVVKEKNSSDLQHISKRMKVFGPGKQVAFF